MASIVRKLITLFLALLLCLVPMATHAESLLGDRFAAAFGAGKTVELSIGFEPDKNIGMFELVPEESFAVLQEILRATTLRISAMSGDAERMEFSFEVRVKEIVVMDGHIWWAGGILSATTSLLPGKTLCIDMKELAAQLGEPMEQFIAQVENLQAISASAEAYLAIIFDWLDSTEGLLSVSEGEIQGTSIQDPSVETYLLSVSPIQLQELLAVLAAGFEQDEALAQLLSLSGLSLVDGIMAFEPTDDVMELVIYLDAQGRLAGVYGTVPEMFGDVIATSSFAYAHLSAGNDALRAASGEDFEWHRFSGEIAEKNIGSAHISLEAASDPSDPVMPKGSLSVGFSAGEEDSSISAVAGELYHIYQGTIAVGQETLTSRTDFALQGPYSDFALTATLDFYRDVRTVRQDDFLCESTLKVSAMGMSLGRMLMTLVSHAYVPADTAGNEIIDLMSLDEAGFEALGEALSAGMQQAIGLAATAMPDEAVLLLLQMIM